MDKYLLWLNIVLDGNVEQMYKLINLFGNAENVYNTEQSEVYKNKTIAFEVAEALEDRSMEQVEKAIEFCNRYNVKIIEKGDKEYPDRLLYIDKPPLLLYVMGENINIDENVCVAVVGTRSCTEYGRNVSAKLSYEMAKQGAVIVSGIADGIDAAAHKACIEAGGKTVAVLGCGLSMAYPSTNRELYVAVVRSGALVTEYPPYSKPSKEHFPIRNRIISGLSQATVVVESHQRSGALITARHTLRQGKTLYAVPAKITDYSGSGNLELIKNGAKLVTCGADVLEEFELMYPDKIKIDRKITAPLPVDDKREEIHKEKKQTKTVKAADKSCYSFEDIENHPDYDKIDNLGRTILKFLLEKDCDADELVRSSKAMIDEVLQALTFLELFGFITAIPGGKYTLNISDNK